jgi:peptidoglycan hydrolase-like protein with peptidoglycan-binding domain
MQRVICHWSEGHYRANSIDLEHYHILIEGGGDVRFGEHTIDDNVSTSDDDYAAHTRGANTGSIGVACCCMVGCNERPFRPGPEPMTQEQWNAMCQVVAELCAFYKIPVTDKTVLGHGEVQKNLNRPQLGKWDPMVWPWDTSKTASEVGNALRSQVQALLAGGQPPSPAPVPVTSRGPSSAAPAASAPRSNEAYALGSPLLAADPALVEVAATDAVLMREPGKALRIPGIATIQKALNQLAETLGLPAINLGDGEKNAGLFGDQTERAIRLFQQKAKIGVDGRIGDDTLCALDEALSGAATPAPTPVRSAAAVAPAPTPDGEFVKTLAKVSNRGVPPKGFLQELVAWGKTASQEIFEDRETKEKDVYASVKGELGPYGDLMHRKACMLEVMRVLAGFESSWKWNTGIDTTNPDENSPDTISAGPFQVSANSLAFGKDLKDLVAPHGIRNAKRDGDAFQALMKTNHPVAFNYISRLLRHTIRHNGPVKRSEINKWLSRDAVAELQKFLA